MNDVAQQTYNGWCNRETWLVNVWLTNDEGSGLLLEEARRKKGSAYDKAEWLESALHEWADERFSEASLWTDLLRSSLNKVNWYELVSAY